MKPFIKIASSVILLVALIPQESTDTSTSTPIHNEPTFMDEPMSRVEPTNTVEPAGSLKPTKNMEPTITNTKEPVSTVQPSAPSKPSYDSIKGATDNQILALRGKAQSELLELVMAHQATEDSKEKAKLKAQGISKMAGYDATFAAILYAFETELKSNGYEVAIIADYQQQYNQEKQVAQALLGP
jgi:hypothetical protein